jgi:YidC/Oxa1 family membrane protein insertase
MKKNLNVIFAVLFLFGFIYLWDTLVMSRYGAPKRDSAKAASPLAPAANPAADEAADRVIRDVAADRSTGRAYVGDSVVSLHAEGTEVIFQSAGARVGSWHVLEKGRWLEMLLPEKQREVSPLETFGNLTFKGEKKSESQVVFSAVHPTGFEIRKTITLLSKPPFHSVTLELTNPTKQDLVVETLLGWGNGIDKHFVDAPYDRKSSVANENRAVALGAKPMSWRPGVIFGREVDRIDEGAFQWVGVDNHHFLAAIVAPEGTTIPKIQVSVNRKHAPVAGSIIQATLKPGETIRREYLLFVGPKQADLLATAGHGLPQAVDYGTFGIISKALLAGLKFYRNLTGNYGWAIILLTLTIQIVMFPLTKKSLEHSVKMKELQPHLKKLQEQYKDDPKRYQLEMMNFYKKNGMKFMGLEGCLPLLLQMPIFLAFYSTLNNAYDLRGAHWILWIHDLAAKDPHYVLPVLMGGGMFLQQKMSGSAVDPAQARMMMIMPIVFTFMFLSMPSGLVLYWVVNSIVTIIVQKFLAWRAHSRPIGIVS